MSCDILLKLILLCVVADYYDLAYPGVIMRILLTRKMSYHLMQTYVPSTIFVSLAWLSIFIPPEQVPGKQVNRATMNAQCFQVNLSAVGI